MWYRFLKFAAEKNYWIELYIGLEHVSPFNVIFSSRGSVPPKPPTKAPPILALVPDDSDVKIISSGPTKEQQEMGGRGEEWFLKQIENIASEFKDRTGFSKYDEGETDVRKSNPSPGFDFHCLKDEVEAYVEVKTFKEDGKIFITHHEWETAKKYADMYWFIGLKEVTPRISYAYTCINARELLNNKSWQTYVYFTSRKNLFPDRTAIDLTLP